MTTDKVNGLHYGCSRSRERMGVYQCSYPKGYLTEVESRHQESLSARKRGVMSIYIHSMRR